MRAVVMTKHGGPEVLELQLLPDPPPSGEGEITIAVAAASVAFSEVAARAGVYPPAPKPPAVLGTDIAGTVAAVGAGVDGLVGINYATAWMALVDYGGIAHRPRARVLVHAAAGGVRVAATQIARRYDAEIWGTCRPTSRRSL
jgi:NADPH:quinone reductase-like Zn-dependent oxidoreductase